MPSLNPKQLIDRGETRILPLGEGRRAKLPYEKAWSMNDKRPFHTVVPYQKSIVPMEYDSRGKMSAERGASSMPAQWVIYPVPIAVLPLLVQNNCQDELFCYAFDLSYTNSTHLI